MIKSFIALTALTIVFASCQKEATDKAAALQSTQTARSSSAFAAAATESPTFSVADNGDGTFTATLQPNATNGQDVHVEWVSGQPINANTNFNADAELDMTAWTVNGNPILLRSYLRFVDLANIPSTAQVLSATLYLYGISSSRPNPQGNYGDNRCVIEPVNGPWNETTITWNTQPRIKREWGHASIAKSTSEWNYDVAVTDVKGMVTRAVMYPDKNYGVRIRLTTEATYRNLMFATSEASEPAKRPKLVVVYK